MSEPQRALVTTISAGQERETLKINLIQDVVENPIEDI